MSRKLDLDAIRARVAQQTAIANPDAVEKMVQGAVFEIPDKLVHFPEDPNREAHPLRRVIVVQHIDFLSGVRPSTTLVVPCSASASVARGDCAIPDGEPAFSKNGIVAYTSLVMPILKKELLVEHFRGNLRVETLGQLMAQIGRNLGLTMSSLATPTP